MGTYFTIRRLLPFFQQSSPSLASGLQDKLNQLGQGKDDIIPAQERSSLDAGFDSKKTAQEEPDDILSKIERAASTRERDNLYAVAAERATLQNDQKARELADKIEDEGFRRIVRKFVDVVLIRNALKKRDSAKALQLVPGAKLSHFQSVWCYTELAALLDPTRRQEALELLNQAISEAEHIEANTPENAEAWVDIAANALALDPARRAAILVDVVRAVNRTENYIGDEDSFLVEFRSSSKLKKVTIPVPKLSLANLFASMAKEDIHQTADMAQSIKNESARAIALLAAGQAVLEMKTVAK